jgi:hypothetical protein
MPKEETELPIYEFLCSAGHRTENLYNSLESRPKTVLCWKPGCTHAAHSVISAPNFRFRDADHLPVMDRAKDIFEGIPGLEDGDGINPGEYVSKTVQFDLAGESKRNKAKMDHPMGNFSDEQ